MQKKIKVCGLTRFQDVQKAVELGADLVGFVLAEGKRSVSLKKLSELVRIVPATVATVGVVVNPSKAVADRTLEFVDRLQFHGEESPEFCNRYGRRSIKAFRIRDPRDLELTVAYKESVGAFLLDSFMEGQQGGTGHTFPWTYLQQQSFALPTFLAGGLNPGNAAQAARVESVQGLDLSSGLEESPGKKSEQLMQAFFSSVKGA